jgi:hypothetical protein
VIPRISFAWLALALTGCEESDPTPQPTPGSEETPSFPLQAQVLGSGSALDGYAIHAEGETQLTDALGFARFDLPAAPPWQVDFMFSAHHAQSAGTCGETAGFRIPDEIIGSGARDTVHITFVGPSDLRHASIHWLSPTPWQPVTDRPVDAPEDEGVTSLDYAAPDSPWWELVVSVPDADGTVWFGAAEGVDYVEGDGLDVEILLAPTSAGETLWDGEVPDGAESVVLLERVERRGAGVYLAVTPPVGAGGRTVPVLDGRFGILEYGVRIAWTPGPCDTSETLSGLPAIEPGETLTLESAQGPVPLTPVSGWSTTPDVRWDAPPDTQWFGALYGMDEDWQTQRAWVFRAGSDCLSEFSWPADLDPMPSTPGWGYLIGYGGANRWECIVLPTYGGG